MCCLKQEICLSPSTGLAISLVFSLTAVKRQHSLHFLPSKQQKTQLIATGSRLAID